VVDFVDGIMFAQERIDNPTLASLPAFFRVRGWGRIPCLEPMIRQDLAIDENSTES